MDFTPKPTFSVAEITPEIAKAIYSLIKKHGNYFLAFKNQENSLYEPAHFEITNNAFKELKTDIYNKMQGKHIITPAVLDEEGNVTKEAVYFEATTKQALLDTLETTLLDCSLVLDDIIVWDDGEYKEDRTFDEFKELFNT